MKKQDGSFPFHTYSQIVWVRLFIILKCKINKLIPGWEYSCSFTCLDLNAKGVILQAFEMYRLKSCVDFKPYEGESTYISFTKLDGYVKINLVCFSQKHRKPAFAVSFLSLLQMLVICGRFKDGAERLHRGQMWHQGHCRAWTSPCTGFLPRTVSLWQRWLCSNLVGSNHSRLFAFIFIIKVHHALF